MINALESGIVNEKGISSNETIIMFIGLMIGNIGGEFGVVGTKV